MLDGRSAPVGPLVSVVIPAYDRADTLTRAVRSVLEQNLRAIELLVVDDGSTDTTLAKLVMFDDDRLRVVSQDHAGASVARNRGAEESGGRFLAFLDSDDEARPTWLECLVARASESVSIVCCGAAYRYGDRDDELVQPDALGPAFGDVDGLFLAGTFLVERELFLAVGGYAPAVRFGENTELALRLVDVCLRRGRSVATVTDPLIVVHGVDRPLRPGSYTAAKLESAEYILEHDRDLLGRSRDLLGRYLAIAGVNAARLGRYRDARKYFAQGVRLHPELLRPYGRLALSMLPLIRNRVWREMPSRPLASE